MKRKAAQVLLSVVLLTGLGIGLVGYGAEDLAELHVTKIFLDPPSTIVRGQVVEIYTRISNTGHRSADDFAIGFYYRPVGSAGWTLAERRDEISLAPSQQDFLETKFNLATQEMDLGSYEVRIVADMANEIPEIDELNNELVTTMTLVESGLGLPDLQADTLEYERSNPSTTDDSLPWNVSTTIRNEGESQSGPFSVVFLVNGVEFDRKFEFVLPVGGSKTLVGVLDPFELGLRAGTHSVSVIVDMDEQVVEQDEGNNIISGSLTLLSPELLPKGLAFDKSIVRLDEEVRVSAEVCNVGEGAATSVEVAFYANHIRFGTAEIDLLGQGQVASVEAILDPEKAGIDDAPAVYEIRVVVDPDDLHNELDEANNEMARTLTILEAGIRRPEIHPESLELTPASPAEIGRSQTVTLRSVIKNTGRADADGLHVGFYYRVKGGLRWNPLSCADGVSCGEVLLQAGEQATLVGTLSLAGLNLQPGIYEVRVATDPEDAIEELDELNNELVTTLTLLASRRPDLAVAIESIEPLGSLQIGQTARVTASVTNVGESASNATTLRLSYCELSGTSTGQQVSCADPGGFDTLGILPDSNVSIPALGIGESHTVLVNVETVFMAPGQYQVRAQVDPSNLVAEQDEIAGAVAAQNNVAARNIIVLGADLVPVSGSFRMDPDGVIDQSTVEAVDFAVTIQNAGEVAAGQFYVTFGLFRIVEGAMLPVEVQSCFDNGQECGGLPYFGRVQVSGLGARSQLAVGCTLNLAAEDLEEGQYIVQAYVDRASLADPLSVALDEGNVEEHNETNNSAELILTLLGEVCVNCDPDEPVEGGADFELRFPQMRAKPDDIRVYAQVFNLGEGGPQTVEVVFTVTRPSGLVVARSGPIQNIDPLLPGESVFVGTRFFEGTDFYGPLALGDTLHLSVEILTPDGTPANNVGERVTIVRE